jgi:hypothetical protein
MEHRTAQDWLNRYVAAWLSYDPDDVAALFSENIAYRYHPYDDPIMGRAGVVASWLGEAESEGGSTRDKPGTYEADYSPIAVDGDTVVATALRVIAKRPTDPSCAPTTTAS